LNSLDSLDPLDSLDYLDSLGSLDYLDSLGSLDSSYSSPRFIVSYIIVFELRIPQEFRIHGVRTGLKFCRMERQTFISCSYIQSDCNFLEIIIA
jgi:hypothetical protein